MPTASLLPSCPLPTGGGTEVGDAFKNLSPIGISLKFLLWEDATEPTLRAFLREGVNSLLQKPDPALGGWQGVARCGRRAHSLCLTSGLNLSCLEVQLDCAGRL